MHTPPLLYGTAWKEDDTERLTLLALSCGFRGIDTANQRRHYHEAGVGAALARAFASKLVTRDQLFLQTKFTSPDGQDQRLPYDASAEPARQVEQSFQSSLEHLGVDTLDAYLLHGPTTRVGLSRYDLAVWRAMEALADGKQARALGASNVTLEQLQILCDQAKTPPAFVQNRCYARTGWDATVRAFCRAHGIVYQGFSLLTANQSELRDPRVKRLADRLGRTIPQLVFAFARALGMLPLTGTTDERHMREDLASEGLRLAAADVHLLEQIGER